MDRYLGTTKEQRKMARAVAKDVISRINVYDFTPGYGYLYTQDASGKLEGKDIKSATEESIAGCHVCVRGAMFISRAKLFNSYTFPSYQDSSLKVVSYTAQDFGKRNAGLIECAYENSGDHHSEAADSKLPAKAVSFGKRFKIRKNLVKAIMQNVIDNGGVFRPDKVKTKVSG